MIVQAPDGKVIDFGDVSPEIVTSTLSKMYPPEPKLQVSPSTTGMATAIDAVPFGSDVAASFDALKNDDPNKSFGENQAASKTLLEQGIKAGTEQNPKSAIAGTLTGAAATIPLIPAKALQGTTMALRLAKGAGLGATFGGLHGAGEGNDLGDRANNAVSDILYGGVAGTGGALASDVLSLGARKVGLPLYNLAARAANLIKNKIAPTAGDEIGAESASAMAPSSGLSPDRIVPNIGQSATGEAQAPQQGLIPLTQGQATQDPVKQALEIDAAKGAYGQEAQLAANKAREIQSESAKQALSGVAGSEIHPELANDASANIVSNLRDAYKAAKDKTSAAYKNVGDLANGVAPQDVTNTAQEARDQFNQTNNLRGSAAFKSVGKDKADYSPQISGYYIRSGLTPLVKDWATTGSNGLAWDLEAKGMENAKRLYDKAIDFVPKSGFVGSKDFFQMENWRSAVSQGIRDATTPSEKAFLSGMLNRYDTAMDQLPREAIKGGNPEILDAMEKARYSRSEQGRLFERSKMVRDIVQNENLTNEEFANSIMSLGPKSGSYVKDVLNAASNNPALQAQLQGQIKQAVLGSIVNKSLSAEVKAGGTVDGGIENMISFDKLATNLNKLIGNKTLFEKTVPDAAERDVIQQAYGAAKLIKSMKPGTVNYSNTATKLLSLVQGTSANIVAGGVGKFLKSAQNSQAQLDLQKSLAPVLKGISDNSNAVTNFGDKYGRNIMAGVSNAKGNIDSNETLDNALRVTIRPSDREKK